MGPVREAAVGFAIGDKGYIGTGRTPDDPFLSLKDFWEYDPSANALTEPASIFNNGKIMNIFQLRS